MSNLNDILALIESADQTQEKIQANIRYEKAERLLDEFLLNLGTSRQFILENENHDLYPLIYPIEQRILDGYKRFQ